MLPQLGAWIPSATSLANGRSASAETSSDRSVTTDQRGVFRLDALTCGKLVLLRELESIPCRFYLLVLGWVSWCYPKSLLLRKSFPLFLTACSPPQGEALSWMLHTPDVLVSHNRSTVWSLTNVFPSRSLNVLHLLLFWCFHPSFLTHIELSQLKRLHLPHLTLVFFFFFSNPKVRPYFAPWVIVSQIFLDPETATQAISALISFHLHISPGRHLSSHLRHIKNVF